MSCTLKLVLDYYETQKLCSEAIEENLYNLACILDRFVTQEMCNKAVEEQT